VHDFLVDARAQGCRKALIAFERRNAALLGDIALGEIVKLRRRNSGDDARPQLVGELGRRLAGLIDTANLAVSL
jgi:hypothetical protein